MAAYHPLPGPPPPDPCQPRAAALPQAPDWRAAALATQLAPLWPGISVEVVASAVSTNSLLLARGRAVGPAGDGPPMAPCVLVAEQQTGGRGRHGRAWQSQRGASLTFSVALPYGPADGSGLSLAVGVAIAEALDGGAAVDGPGIGLKWPNDLWLLPRRAAVLAAPSDTALPDHAVVGRKLGGILVETVSTGGGRRLAVIGVGLNVQPFASPLLPPGDAVASLAELDERANAPAVLACLLPPLMRALQQFERDGFAAFAARFAARDALRGRRVVAGPHAGVADGVGADGALRLRTPQGLRTVVGGEVSVRLQPAAPQGAP